MSGPCALVTGARGGLGGAVVDRLLQDGYGVAALDVTPLPTVPHDQAARFDLQADVRDESAVRAAVQEIEARWARLDLVVNVAGINYRSPVEETDLDRWERVLAVNVTGAVAVLKHAVPLLRRAEPAVVVNMSSVSAGVGSHGYSAYVASKAAMDGLTKSLSLELAPGIRVCAVAPGWVDTEFSGFDDQPDPEAARRDAGLLHALGRVARPSEVAAAVSWLASDDASFVTGTTLTVDGGFTVNR